jgi:membrane peptidoglycan carboxypeptidase
MVQAPTRYSPYGSNRAELEARKNLVLNRMKQLRFITEEEYEKASAEVVSFASQRTSAIIAPHFVFYVLEQLRQKYGESALVSGLKVITTLDADFQVKAESIATIYAERNEKNFGAKNEAIVALDPQTGQILAMVGSRNFFDTEIDGQFNAALGLRQPGSTMKPFIYALALMRGFTRNTVVFDVPTQFSTACIPTDITNSEPPCYAPKNFDEKSHGPVTLESALAQSINIPALKTLYLVGIRDAITFATAFGLTSLGDPDQYGLTLVLGGGEVRLLDLTSAYGVFAADGMRNSPAGILEVADGDGIILEQYTRSAAQIIPPSIARDMSAMLSDNQARVPTYSLNNPFNFPGHDVAAKTGTTNDTRDTWVVGYTPSIVIGVWVGNNDNTPMIKSVAGFIAAPLWHDLMAYALTKYPKAYFGEPSPILSSLPPMLRGTWTIPDASGQVVPHDILHWVDKRNPVGPPPANPENDPQYAYWEYGVQVWAAQNPAKLVNPPIFVPLSDPVATSTPQGLPAY